MNWILDFWIRTPVASNSIRGEVFFPVAGSGLDFVFTGKTLLVVCLTYIYPAVLNSSVDLVPGLRSNRILQFRT